MIELIPIVGIISFGLYYKINKNIDLFSGVLVLSYFFFATNYSNFGLDLDFDIYRVAHKTIGLLVVLKLFVIFFKQKINPFKQTYSILFFGFLVAILLSYVGNDLYIEYYLHYLRNFLFSSMLALYLFHANEGSKEKFNSLLSLIVIFATILSIFALINLSLEQEWSRVKLHFSNPNYLAYAIAIGFGITISKNWKYKYLLAGLLLFAIFYSGSRSVLIAAFVVLLIELFFNKRNIFWALNLSTIVLILIISIFNLSYQKIFINSHVNSTRIALTHIGMNMFDSHPLNGIGYGQFRKQFFKYMDEDIQISNHDYELEQAREQIIEAKKSGVKLEKLKGEYTEIMTHNDFLKVVSELGIFGVMVIITFFIQTLKTFISHRETLLEKNRVSLYLFLLNIIFSLFHNNITTFFFWFSMILPILLINIEKKK